MMQIYGYPRGEAIEYVAATTGLPYAAVNQIVHAHEQILMLAGHRLVRWRDLSELRERHRRYLPAGRPRCLLDDGLFVASETRYPPAVVAYALIAKSAFDVTRSLQKPETLLCDIAWASAWLTISAESPLN